MVFKRTYPKTPWGRIRHALGMTQSEFAALLKRPQTRISEMEKPDHEMQWAESALLKCFQADPKGTRDVLEGAKSRRVGSKH